MRTSTLKDYKERLLRVLVHIQRNLDGPLPLEELAAIACLSPSHFHRMFSGMLGESLQAHIRRLRLERAAGALKRGGEPIVQVAFAAGYETHEAFTRAFREAFGQSPSEYRRSNGFSAAFGKTHPAVHYTASGNLRGFRATRLSSKAMNVEIKRLPAKRVAFVRHTGPYNQVGAAWDKLCTLLGKDGHLGPDSEFLGLSYDDPAVTAPQQLRYDACVTVGPSFRPSGDVGVQEIPGGDYAVVTHFGPYERLNDTYTALFGRWLPRSGRQLRDNACVEHYLNSPENTAPSDLVTDILVPLESP